MTQPQSLIRRLEQAAGQWARANDRSLARLATLVINDGKFFARLAARDGADTTTTTLGRFALFLIDPANWPDGKVGRAAWDLAEVTGIIVREQRTHGGDSAIDDPLPECAGDGVAGVVPHPGPAPETGRGAAAMRPGARALSGGRGQE